MPVVFTDFLAHHQPGTGDGENMQHQVDQGWLASAVRGIGVRALGLVITAALLPFGSVMTLPFLLVTALCLVLLFLSAILFPEPQAARRLFRMALVVVLLGSGWTLVQALPQVPLSWQADIWNEARAFLPDLAGRISLAPGDAVLSALTIVLPMSVFMTGLILCDTDERARLLLAVLGTVGGLAAIFGLAQFLMAPDTLIVIDKKSYLDSLTGPFINRNTAATFFGLVLLINLARLRDHLMRFSWRSKSVGLADQLNLIALAVFALAALMALMLTRSRAGIAASGLASLIYLPYLVADWKKLSARSRDPAWLPLAWGVGSFLLTLVAFAFFSAQAILRLKTLGLSEDGRFCIMPNLLKASGNSWPFGSGFGAFRFAFAPYRDPACGIAGIFDRAHNGYIEGLMGMGALFPVLVAIVVVSLLLTLKTGWRNRRRSRHYSVLGLSGLVLCLVHAGFDFSLQIPGFAVFFAAFMAGISAMCLMPIRTAPAVVSAPGSEIDPVLLNL